MASNAHHIAPRRELAVAVMVELLDEREDAPQSPTAPEGADPSPNGRAAWRRVEAWVWRRWEARPVSWIIRGPGEFRPPLAPFTLGEATVWRGDAWSPVSLTPSPLGYALAAETYQIAGTVGDDTDPPEEVDLAFQRLLAFYSRVTGEPAGGAVTIEGLGELRPSTPNWQARALHQSGAADLLRAWKRIE